MANLPRVRPVSIRRTWVPPCGTRGRSLDLFVGLARSAFGPFHEQENAQLARPQVRALTIPDVFEAPMPHSTAPTPSAKHREMHILRAGHSHQGFAPLAPRDRTFDAGIDLSPAGMGASAVRPSIDGPR